MKTNNDNNNLKITYAIKPSFTTRKIKELQQENKQLKDNWNELKTDIGYELLKLREPNEYNEGLFNGFTYINNKIQELEQGSDSNE